MNLERLDVDNVAEMLRKIKYGYLKAQDESGGWAQNHKEYVRSWARNPEHREFLIAHWDEIVDLLASASWNAKLSTVSNRQLALTINGDPAPVELHYKDRRPKSDRVPGGYITVLTECATIEQFAWAWEEVQRNANVQTAAAAKMYEQVEWLRERANYHDERRVADILDGVESIELA